MTQFNARLQLKQDVSSNWELISDAFVPLAGEVIIFTDLNRFKVGNGTSTLAQLRFANLNEDDFYALIDGSISNIENTKTRVVRDYGFYEHPNLTQVNFPIATTIGNYAFYKNAKLKSVNLPQATVIGASAFKGNTALTTISLPAATSLGDGAFNECSALASVNIPNITSLGGMAFRRCAALKTLTLSKSLTIKSQAFWGSGLTTLTLSSSTLCPLENVDALAETPIAAGAGTIKVPSSLVSQYKSAANWSTYANRIVAI